MSTPEGQVFDLGYRHYDGPREGRTRARRALFVNGVRTCFGLGRGAWAKVLPVLFLVAVMAPAAILSIMAGLLGEVFADVLDLPGPQDYYAIVSPILLIFAAIIAPELLCSDRKSGVINLYLVRPLSSNDYVASRWLSFFAVSLVFIYAGQVVLLTGLAMGSEEPFAYVRENWAHVPRFLLAGLAIAAVTTTIPLAAASLTTRRAYASLAVIGLFVVTTVVVAALSEIDCVTSPDVEQSTSGRQANSDSTSGASLAVTFGSGGLAGLDNSNTGCEPELGIVGRWARLLDFGGIPLQISDLIFGEYEEELTPETELIPLPPSVAVVWWIVIVSVPAAVLWSRYRRLVT
ncbi:MAG: ABC transporter permease subunit [Dehalococcoidia bacterium]|nr:ABC transporter permease subunit [Dehalococcoidia bacterium]